MLALDTAPSVAASQSPALRPPVGRTDRTAGRPATSTVRVRASLDRVDEAVHRWLVAYSIAILRVSLGAVFLGFGALKLLGVSPAANLVEATTHIVFLGLVPGPIALVGVGLLECTIGVLLIAGRGMRPAIYMLAAQLVGILSPIVLLAPRLFSGPHNAPTLEGQYVLKDIVFVGAAMVIAATLGGGRLATGPGTIDAGAETRPYGRLAAPDRSA
jgi:uncharacterized membrane protein YphA (DoxX/SURF4 family)